MGGNYSVLSTSVMDECTPLVFPGPASIKVEYVNETAYASYHYQGVKDCSGSERKFLAYWTVGSCESFEVGNDVWSQMRVWVRKSIADGAGNLCMNDDDQKVYQTIKANISNVQKDCIFTGVKGDSCFKHFMGSAKEGQDCVSDCVDKKTSLSTTCSSCFGQISACVYSNCVMHCLDAKSPDCISCTKDHCKKDFVTCTGFDDLPPVELSMHKELADQVVV